MTSGGGVGTSSAHPLALQQDWSLRHGKPLSIPRHATLEYVPCIFTSSLTGALPWQGTWAAQVLSALAWAQVALASDYGHMVVMRALHKAVHRVYSASLWGAENTMCTVYTIAHHQPCAHSAVVKWLIHWLTRNTQWEDTRYTFPTIFQPEGYQPAWCADMHLLRALSAA